MRARVAGLVLVCAVVGLVACEPLPPVERLPGRHVGGGTPTVWVFGDSLAPVTDYALQARASGYRLVATTASGSWMCGGHQLPQTDEGRWWPRIMDTIATERPEYLVLEYQGWANYQLRCGGRPASWPYDASDPGKGWRVYLDMFADAVVAAGGRTRIVVVGSPGAPPERTSWTGPQAIMDQASRVMAARRPAQITWVPIRAEVMPGGRWATSGPCRAFDPAGSCSGGQVRLRSSDGIHYWCPTGGVAVCGVSTPAGLRIRRVVFEVLNTLTRDL